MTFAIRHSLFAIGNSPFAIRYSQEVPVNYPGLIRAVRGAPLTVLVTLLLNCDEPMRTEQIIAATGYSKKTVATALSTLRALNLADNHTRCGGWQATAQIQQLLLPAPEEQGADLPGEGEILPLPGSSSGFDQDQDQEDPDPETKTTTTTEGENFSLPEPWQDLVTLLVQRCTTPPATAVQAITRARDENYYPSYIRYEILRWLAFCLSERGRSIRHMGAYIAGRIAKEISCPDWFTSPNNAMTWEIKRAEIAWQREDEQDKQETGAHDPDQG
jgi:hypothetical protein